MFTLAGPQTIGPALRRAARSAQRAASLHHAVSGRRLFANDFRDSFDIEFEIFIGDFGRPATDDHRATYLPNLFTTSFKAEDDGREDHKPIDVVCILVGPPNEAGYCNVGPNLWNKRMYARRARTVIAEVDRSQISTHGDCWPARLRDRLLREHHAAAARATVAGAARRLAGRAAGAGRSDRKGR
ncbi:MAG: hypothetical protein U0531_06670 [Dehalococcoidia bacterium]